MSVEDEMVTDLLNIRNWVVDLECRFAKEIEDLLETIDKTVKIYRSKAHLKEKPMGMNEHVICDLKQRVRDINSDRSIY